MSQCQPGKEKTRQIRDLILAKTWFGFDLDDTLHEFRKASRAATLATLQIIERKHKIPIEELTETYSQILKMKTAQAFTERKTSDEYRKERFAAVLEKFAISPTDAFLDELAATYKAILAGALELKPGAMKGPQDAQEWTIQKLGLEIDFLATTNAFGVSKVEGLFARVLQRLEIEAKDMVYIGDSEERDIAPARKQGILAVHYNEKGGVLLDSEQMKIDALWRLEHILRGEEEEGIIV